MTSEKPIGQFNSRARVSRMRGGFGLAALLLIVICAGGCHKSVPPPPPPPPPPPAQSAAPPASRFIGNSDMGSYSSKASFLAFSGQSGEESDRLPDHVSASQSVQEG